jgi:hypothetical protein
LLGIPNFLSKRPPSGEKRRKSSNGSLTVFGRIIVHKDSHRRPFTHRMVYREFPSFGMAVLYALDSVYRKDIDTLNGNFASVV